METEKYKSRDLVHERIQEFLKSQNIPVDSQYGSIQIEKYNDSQPKYIKIKKYNDDSEDSQHGSIKKYNENVHITQNNSLIKTENYEDLRNMKSNQKDSNDTNTNPENQINTSQETQNGKTSIKVDKQVVKTRELKTNIQTVKAPAIITIPSRKPSAIGREKRNNIIIRPNSSIIRVKAKINRDMSASNKNHMQSQNPWQGAPIDRSMAVRTTKSGTDGLYRNDGLSNLNRVSYQSATNKPVYLGDQTKPVYPGDQTKPVYSRDQTKPVYPLVDNNVNWNMGAIPILDTNKLKRAGRVATSNSIIIKTS